MMKRYLLLLVILAPLIGCDSQRVKDLFRDEEREQQLEDSISVILDDIEYAVELIDDLYTMIDSLEQIKRKPIMVEKIVERVDTIRLTQGGFNVDKIYNISLDQTERYVGSVFNIKGVTSFKWDFLNNEPLTATTTINDFQLRLNVRTRLKPVTTGLEVESIPLSPNIMITHNTDNVIDKSNYFKEIPSKISIGIIGGYGFTHQGATPFIGVGINYSLLEAGDAIRRLKGKIPQNRNR